MVPFEKTVKLAKRRPSGQSTSSKDIRASISALREQRGQIDAQIIKLEHDLLDSIREETVATLESAVMKAGSGPKTISPALNLKFQEDWVETLNEMRKEKERQSLHHKRAQTLGSKKSKELLLEKKPKEEKKNGDEPKPWQTIKLSETTQVDAMDDGWMIGTSQNKKISPRKRGLKGSDESKEKERLHKHKARDHAREKEKKDPKTEKEHRVTVNKETEQRDKKENEEKHLEKENMEWDTVALSESTRLHVMDDGWMVDNKKQSSTSKAEKTDKPVKSEHAEKKSHHEKDQDVEIKREGLTELKITGTTIFDVHDDGWLLPKALPDASRQRRSVTDSAPKSTSGRDKSPPAPPSGHDIKLPHHTKKKVALDDDALPGSYISKSGRMIDTPASNLSTSPEFKTLGRASRLQEIGRPRRALEAEQYVYSCLSFDLTSGNRLEEVSDAFTLFLLRWAANPSSGLIQDRNLHSKRYPQTLIGGELVSKLPPHPRYW